jgi:hypothetical protein
MPFQVSGNDSNTLEGHDVDKQYTRGISDMRERISQFDKAVESAKDFAPSIVGLDPADLSKLSAKLTEVAGTGLSAKSAIRYLELQPKFNIKPCSEIFTKYWTNVNHE